MTKKPKSPRDKIIAQMLGWEPEERVLRDLANEKERFASEGITQGRYAVRGVYGLMFGAYMSQQNLAIRRACAGETDEAFANALVEMSRMYYWDLRFSKACLREQGRIDFVRMLGDLIVQADLSLALGLTAQAEWMYRAYLENSQEALASGDYVDPEIDALTRLTAALWFDGPAALQALDLEPYGVYRPLVQSLAEHRFDAASLNRYIDERQIKSAWRYTEDEEGNGLTFYAVMFAALFPVEILALLQAYAKHYPIEYQVHDIFTARLLRARNIVAKVDEAFFAIVEPFILGLESKVA